MNNKKGEGEVWLLLIFLALIPLCSHAGETSYSQCIDDCSEIHFNTVEIGESGDENYTIEYHYNGSKVNKSFVKKYCYKECKQGENTENEMLQ